jgi:hypothetical protein
MILSSELACEVEIPSFDRSRIASALYQLCVEHQQGVHTLTEHALYGSAFALLRPQLEGYIRGLWFHRCATEHQVVSLMKGAEPPKIRTLLLEIQRIPDYDSKSLIETKTAVWGVLNDLTHGGGAQVKARLTTEGVESNYKLEHVVGMLRWSSVLSLMGYVGVASIAEHEDLAGKLRDGFQSVYLAEDWSVPLIN